MLQLKLLGRFGLSDGARAIAVPGVRDRALLAFLAITGTSHNRERLANLLWSGRGDEQARQSLRQSLSGLRKLGVPVLADGRERVGLSSMISCDAQAVAERCASGHLDELRQAVDLYEGALLSDWTANLPDFEEWLMAERARFAALAVKTVLRLLAWSAPRLESAERLFLARKALGVDPYHEEAHRQELTALIDMGLRGEAVLAHQGFAAALRKDLGIEPARETAAVAARARTQAGPQASDPPKEDQGLALPTPRMRRPRLAVFPLRPSEPGAASDYLAFGVMSEIADVLSRFASIEVIAPRSSFQLADAPERLQRVAETLRADYIVEGTLITGCGEIEVRLELVDMADGNIVLSERRSGGNVDYPAFTRHLAHAVANRIDSRIGQLQRSRSEAADPSRRAAWDTWLRAQHISEKWGSDSEAEAERLFRQALAADPTLARACSSLALLLNGRILVQPGIVGDNELRKEAIGLARQAVDLDPHDPRSHLAMAWVSLFLCDRQRAMRHAQLAYESNPHSADTLMHVALLKAYSGDADTSLALADEALDLNPLFPDWYLYFKAQILILAGRPLEALELALGVADSFIELPGWLAIAAAEAGDEAALRDMVSGLLSLTRRHWTGDEPWTKQRATEWFLSVNRWLTGAQRDMVRNGLRKAGLM
jgi:DNA-binding SARP family transcriptional activator